MSQGTLIELLFTETGDGPEGYGLPAAVLDDLLRSLEPQTSYNPRITGSRLAPGSTQSHYRGVLQQTGDCPEPHHA